MINVGCAKGRTSHKMWNPLEEGSISIGQKQFHNVSPSLFNGYIQDGFDTDNDEEPKKGILS